MKFLKLASHDDVLYASPFVPLWRGTCDEVQRKSAWDTISKWVIRRDEQRLVAVVERWGSNKGEEYLWRRRNVTVQSRSSDH